MTIRFRRLMKIAPGLNLTISKRSLGLNAGVRGAHLSVNTRGRITQSVGIPGTGLSNINISTPQKRGRNKKQPTRQTTNNPSNVVEVAKPLPSKSPGIFASRIEREFFKALKNHDLTQYQLLFDDARSNLPAKVMAAHLAMADDRTFDSASNYLAEVFDNQSELLSNKLYQKYVEPVLLAIPIAPGISFPSNISMDAISIIYAEVLQHQNKQKQAKAVLETVTPNQVTAIALAEVETQLGEYDQVLDLTDNLENEDDATAILLVFRGIALRERDLLTASLETFGKVIRTTSRHQDIRHKALLERAKTHLKDKANAKAKQDLEKILATDYEYPGVMELLNTIN
jgi:tetratricopeptide (TPR) repeat protein